MSEFKYGDKILVRDQGRFKYKERYFVGRGTCGKFFCVLEGNDISNFEKGGIPLVEWDEAKALPSYAKLQSKWIEENDLKIGDTVKITRDTNSEEWIHHVEGIDEKVGSLLEVIALKNHGILLFDKGKMDYWVYPFFILEKIEVKEKKYRPFTEIEFKDHRRKALIKKNVNDEWTYLVLKNNNVGVCICGVDILLPVHYEDLLTEFTFEDGSPCGTEVEV